MVKIDKEEIRKVAKALYVSRKLAGRPDYANEEKNWYDATIILADMKKEE